MIGAVGIDLVEIPRIEKIITKWRERFLEKIYSEEEIIYCEKKAFPPQHYAARFAVKEAFLKCVGEGIFSGLRLREIEVINDGRGKPGLRLSQSIKTCIDFNNIKSIHVSISHTDQYANAVVIIER